MSETICFFDVDHTLTRHSTGVSFIFEAARQGLFKGKKMLSSIPFKFLAYRCGYVSFSDLPTFYPALSGITRDELEGVSCSVFEKRIKADIYPTARELVATLKSAGCKIVLATAGLDFIVKPLAKYLETDAVISSSLEFRDGLSTGNFEGVPVFGTVKLDTAREFAGLHGTDLSHCSFYSDSFYDLPLLLETGKSVAINPDRRLAREAAVHGWEILKFRL